MVERVEELGPKLQPCQFGKERLRVRQIDHDDSGVFFKAPEDNFFAIRRYIEVAEEKLWAEVGELTLLTRFQIDRPEVLVPELSL